MKQHAITLAHGTYTELKDTEGAKGTEDKLLWLDIQGTSEELTHFLKERQIPPFLRRRVLSSQRFPSVFSGNDYVLLSVPARKTWVQKRSVSITFILFAQEVITLCRDEGYNFDGERKQLAEGDTASIRSASDLLIALLDSLVETNICNFIEARSQTENLSLHVDNASGKISEQTILDTRRQINHLVNQFEDFFYGLADLHALTPHAMLSDAVREKLAGNTVGLDPMKVIISATHVHTGPRYAHRDDSSSKFTGNATSFRALIESELPPDKKYIESANISANPDIAQPEETFEFLAEQISKAALAAWTSRTEGSFVNAFGRAPVGMCRRVCYNDGSAQMWGNAETAKFTEIEGGNDSGIELMYVFNEKNELTGIVANLACPAQCVQHRLFVSPDFWGEAKMLLRKHFGDKLFMLPLCSPAGDQCPVDLVRWVEPESDVNDPNLKRTNPHPRKADPSMFDLSGMRKAGKRVANEIIEVYNEGLDAPQADPELVHEVHNMQLPLRRTTFAEVAAARRRIHDYLAEKPGDVDFNDAAALQVDLGILRREELQEKMDILDTESHILRLGTVAFATNPFELFLDFGNQIKARSYAEQTFLVQLAGGSEGYLPTEKAEKGGHYSAFIASGLVGHVGGEQLVRETLKNINKLFAE